MDAFRIVFFFLLSVKRAPNLVSSIWELERCNFPQKYFDYWILGIKNTRCCKILFPLFPFFFSILSSNHPIERRKCGTERCNDSTDGNVPRHEVRRLLESRMA